MRRALLALAASLCLATPTLAADSVVDSMAFPVEANPHGVPLAFGWPVRPLVQWGNDPHGFNRALPWLQVFEAAEGTGSTNTRVEVFRLYGRVLYIGGAMDGRWGGTATAAPAKGAMYPEDFSSNDTVPGNLRREPDGGVSVLIGAAAGKVFHTWTDDMIPLDPVHVGCLYATFQARLVVDDPGKPDDRTQARFVAGAGVDYWDNTFTHNSGAVIGQIRRVVSEYRTFGATTCTADQLTAHPVPN